MKTIVKTVLVGLLVCGAAGFVLADTHYVAQNGQTETTPFTNGWTSAASNIQDAVNAATTNDTVLVGPGIYYAPPAPTNYLGVTNVVYISRPITLCSSNGDPASVSIDGQGINRGITWYYPTASSSNFVLNGFTISNCAASLIGATNNGGGVLFAGSTAWTGTMVNCSILNNRASGLGGGIYADNTLNATNCIISGNYVSNSITALSAQGGGFALYQCRLTSCVVSNNATKGYIGGGGSLTVQWKTHIFDRCIFTKNTTVANSYYMGGGAFFGGGLWTNCLIYGNTAGSGGGIQCVGDALCLYNCTVINNKSSNPLGALVGYTSEYVYLWNCIVYSNSASAGYGGAYADVRVSQGSAIITNSCVGVTNIVSGSSGSLTFVNSTTNNPQFVSWQTPNYHLKSTSPCINTGTNQDWMNGATDLDGQRRKDPVYGIVDMGCYEYATKGTLFIIR